jgi:hypothetical protein
LSLSARAKASAVCTSTQKLIESEVCSDFVNSDHSFVTKSELGHPTQRELDMRTSALTQSPCAEAASLWLESRRPYLSPRTFHDYKGYIKILNGYFGEMRLTEIGPDEIRAYQRMRMARAGASCINKECSVLQQMLKRIGRWPEIAANYQPLALPKESPHRALTPLEEDRLYRIGAANPKWEVAYCAFVLSINTTCGPGELRHVVKRSAVEALERIAPRSAIKPVQNELKRRS